MPSQYPEELAAIRKLRAKYPAVPAKKLTMRINTRDFKGDDLATANGASSRSFYSIYSVIRRYDAKQKAVAAAA